MFPHRIPRREAMKAKTWRSMCNWHAYSSRDELVLPHGWISLGGERPLSHSRRNEAVLDRAGDLPVERVLSANCHSSLLLVSGALELASVGARAFPVGRKWALRRPITAQLDGLLHHSSSPPRSSLTLGAVSMSGQGVVFAHRNLLVVEDPMEIW